MPYGVSSRAAHSESRPNSVRNHGLPAARNASSPSRISRPPRSATLCATSRDSRGSGASTPAWNGGCPPGPKLRRALGLEHHPHREARAGVDRAVPERQATVGDLVGRRVEGGRERPRTVRPRQPELGRLRHHGVALRRLALADRCHRRKVAGEGDPQREVEGFPPAMGDGDLLHQRRGSQEASYVDRDRRVVQPPAEPARDIGELLPVGAHHRRAHQLEVAATEPPPRARRGAARRRRTSRTLRPSRSGRRGRRARSPARPR